MIKQEITKLILNTVKKMGVVKPPDFSIEIPGDPNHGDYSTNIAMILASVFKKSPHSLAEELSRELEKNSMFKNVEVAGAGFINFWLSKKILEKSLTDILSAKNQYGRGKSKKEKISLDYLDANPTGPVHIGHARAGFLGDVLSNILEFGGYKVSREFYVNNAKTSAQIQSLGLTALGKGKEYRHDQLAGILKDKKILIKLKKIKDAKEAGFLIAGIIQKLNKDFLKNKAHISFNIFFEEESVYKFKLIDKVLSKLGKKHAIYKEDGAIWFKAKDFGDSEDRVFIRSNGEPTYVLPDIAYHLDRLEKRGFDKVVDIFGADHHGYGPRLIGALSALGVDKERVKIITIQTVRLIRGGKEFKMSKRKGIFATLEDLIDEVGLDAARYFFLEKSPDTHMDFDLDLAKERSVKNPVYYIQYAHARISSILKNAGNSNYKLQITPAPEQSSARGAANYKLLDKNEELNLIKKLIQFPEIISDIALDYQVHRLTRYASELAHEFHNFYEKNRVITEDKELTFARLALVKATQTVIRNSLALLGVSAPERM